MTSFSNADTHAANGRLPNVLIVGAQKSGTTWLHNSLGKSARVFATAQKELNFFNKKDPTAHLEAYRKNFPDGAEYYYFLESTPHYFRLPFERGDVALNIQKILGAPKLITLFRNPIERYESAYIHHMMRERFPYNAEISEICDDFNMLSLGKYAEITRHWQGIFPDLGLFFYDDIQRDPMRLVTRVMAFLGLENDIARSAIAFRTNDKSIKVKTLDSVADWQGMPTCTPDLRRKLRDYYRDDILDLQTLSGRDLSHWLDL